MGRRATADGRAGPVSLKSFKPVSAAPNPHQSPCMRKAHGERGGSGLAGRGNPSLPAGTSIAEGCEAVFPAPGLPAEAMPFCSATGGCMDHSTGHQSNEPPASTSTNTKIQTRPRRCIQLNSPSPYAPCARLTCRRTRWQA